MSVLAWTGRSRPEFDDFIFTGVGGEGASQSRMNARVRVRVRVRVTCVSENRATSA